ncbi:MAG TPA: FtsX-like permease family protein, partial [Balneolaceae bacterium]|nr:FtsX-like permease family protein [Balneolaceae bacterium]
DQYENFIKQKNGAIVGEKIMQKYGWHVGDIVNLGDLQNNITLNLIISGVYKEPPGGTDQMDTRLLVNRDYYDSLIENPGLVSVFWLRLDKPTSTLPVIQAVTDYYSIGPMPVSVETESSMLARLTSYTATIQLVIRVISTVVLFTILLVTINTIALSMRERRKEIAIMKALGYKPSNIIGIVIGEAVVTSLAGSIIGTLLAYTLFNLHTLTISLGLTFDFIIQPQVVITGILLSLLIGILSGVIPAYNASRINVIKVLHSL